MNRAIFFDAIRPHITLNQFAVDGINALLDAGEHLPLHHMANILANVRRETGGIMGPIKETVMAHHRDRNPTDAEVIRRLDRAFARGQLPWVKTPYWRGGAFGRGQLQATHDANYRKFGAIPYSKALEPAMSARIAVVGMMDGMFTGRKLSDYKFPAALDLPPSQNPRRIVNGSDGSDREVAASHRMFAAALERAGWGEAVSTPIAPRATEIPASSFWAGIIAAIAALFQKFRQ